MKWCQNASQEYFVYQLQATPDYVAYCAGSGGVCGSGSAWNPVNSSCTGTTNILYDN